MNHCCLHVDVGLRVPAEEWLSSCEAAVPVMRAVAGLVWKLWILDEPQGRAGGVYLFENAATARAYADGPVLEGLRSSPAVRDVSVRLLPVVDALSRRTFGLGSPNAEVAHERAG